MANFMHSMESMGSVILALAFLLLCYAFFAYGSRTQHQKLPPSPPGAYPVIGHLLMLGKLPHQSLFKLAQRHGGLMYLKLGSIDTVVASTREAAQEILKNHDQVFASRPAVSAAEHFGYNGRDLAWAPYGEYWRHIRKLCTLEILTNKRVEMLQPHRKLEMSLFLKELFAASNSKSEVNMQAKLSDLTFNTMTRIIMNKSCSHGASKAEKDNALSFKQALLDALKAGSGTSFGDFMPHLRWLDTHVAKIKEVKSRMDSHFQREIDEHKERWAKDRVVKDFIDGMLSIGSLSETSIKALTLDMVSAGTDTSAVTVEWALAELVRQPKLMEKAQEELELVIGNNRILEEDDIPKLKFLQAVLKETFRLHPAAPLLLPHESTEVCHIGDYTIPKQCRAIVNVYAVARDAAVWNEPEKFDPYRFLADKADVDVKGRNYELLPFGSGRRMCPGISLGVLMVQYMLGSLLHAFNWHLSNGCKPEDVDMTESFGMTVPRATPLSLLPSPRLSPELY